MLYHIGLDGLGGLVASGEDFRSHEGYQKLWRKLSWISIRLCNWIGLPYLVIPVVRWVAASGQVVLVQARDPGVALGGLGRLGEGVESADAVAAVAR